MVHIFKILWATISVIPIKSHYNYWKSKSFSLVINELKCKVLPRFFFPFSPLTLYIVQTLILFKTPKLFVSILFFMSYSLRLFCSDFSVFLLSFSCPVEGRCLPHPTQLGPEHPPAVHPRCALPTEGVQHSHPIPGGDTRLRLRKGGQEE